MEEVYTYEELDSKIKKDLETIIDVSTGSVEDIAILLQGEGRNILSIINSLSGTQKDTVQKRTYLQSYMGDYNTAIDEREALCRRSPDDCEKKSIIIGLGPVVDQEGAPLGNANIYLDTEKLQLESAILEAEVHENMVHRVRVEKEGYLDSYAKLNGIKGGSSDIEIKPVMAKADTAIVMNNQVGGIYTAGTGISLITYTISPDTFVDDSGSPIKGDVSLYLFSMNRSEQNLSVFSLDVFSQSGSNLGGRMVTDGMPFVTAYSNTKELSIKKPIVGIGTIEKNDRLGNIEAVPKNIWLTNEELTKYIMPGFWRLDRVSGVWKESRIQILDNEGRYKFEIF